LKPPAWEREKPISHQTIKNKDHKINNSINKLYGLKYIFDF